MDVGDRHGKLTIVERTWKQGKARRYRAFRCACDCGGEAVVTVSNMDRTRSCGCERLRGLADAREANGEASIPRLTTHGLSKHPHYTRWYNMVQRCTHPQHAAYPDYGGRGIEIAPEWREPGPFLAYVDATLGPCPAGHSLDRIDNERGYVPGNLRWSTWPEQRKNQRKRRTA